MNTLSNFARALALGLLLIPALAQAGFFSNNSQQDAFLPAEQAFVMDAIALDERTIQVRWTIAPGYYLYRHRLSLDSPEAERIQWQAPQGQDYEDAHFGRVQIFHQLLEIPVQVSGPERTIDLTIGWQGCAEAGLCYPPKNRELTLTLPDQP